MGGWHMINEEKIEQFIVDANYTGQTQNIVRRILTKISEKEDKCGVENYSISQFEQLFSELEWVKPNTFKTVKGILKKYIFWSTSSSIVGVKNEIDSLNLKNIPVKINENKRFFKTFDELFSYLKKLCDYDQKQVDANVMFKVAYCFAWLGFDLNEAEKIKFSNIVDLTLTYDGYSVQLSEDIYNLFSTANNMTSYEVRCRNGVRNIKFTDNGSIYKNSISKSGNPQTEEQKRSRLRKKYRSLLENSGTQEKEYQLRYGDVILSGKCSRFKEYLDSHNYKIQSIPDMNEEVFDMFLYLFRIKNRKQYIINTQFGNFVTWLKIN